MRKINLDGFTPTNVDPGESPELAYLEVADLVFDAAYQREIENRGRKNIQKIAENFQWGRFSPLLVARAPAGKFAVIDGQHRAHAAALAGQTKVPALISELTPSEQASAFSWVNGSITNLTPNQIFKAALNALEPWAVQCDAVVSRAGCRLMPSNASSSRKKPGEVYCIGLVRKLIDAGMSASMIAYLSGLLSSSQGDRHIWYNSIGISAFVPSAHINGVTNSETITAFLAAHDLDEILIAAEKLRLHPDYLGQSAGKMFSESIRVSLKAFLKAGA